MKFKGDLIAIALLPICIGLIFFASQKRKADWHHKNSMQWAQAIGEGARTRWDINEPTSDDHITSREYMDYYASNGMVDRVSQVLKMENGYDRVALSLAAKNNQLEVVKLLLESGLPDLNHIRKASSDAAIAGHLETFKLLFKQDGAFDSESKNYDIIDDALVGGNLEAYKLCLEHYGIKWNEHNPKALRVASFHGNSNIVKYLIEEGADVNSDDSRALQNAAGNDHVEVIRVLISSGADIHAGDDKALRMAANLRQYNAVRILLEHGANVHAYNSKAFRLAAWNGDVEAVKLLLSYGADVHAENEVALQNAVMNENKELVEVLLEAGAQALQIVLRTKSSENYLKPRYLKQKR
jgi:ankyrin repeat protein